LKKILRIVNWIYWLCVLFFFGFAIRYYVLIMWELYKHQEIHIVEPNLTMNKLELGIAVLVVVLFVISVVAHFRRLPRILRWQED